MDFSSGSIALLVLSLPPTILCNKHKGSHLAAICTACKAIHILLSDSGVFFLVKSLIEGRKGDTTNMCMCKCTFAKCKSVKLHEKLTVSRCSCSLTYLFKWIVQLKEHPLVPRDYIKAILHQSWKTVDPVSKSRKKGEQLEQCWVLDSNKLC